MKQKLILLLLSLMLFVSGVQDFENGKVAVVKGYVTEELLQLDYPDLEFYLAKEIATIPAELAQDIAIRIRDAVEMGDVTTLIAIAEDGSIYPKVKQCLNVIDFFIKKFYLRAKLTGAFIFPASIQFFFCSSQIS